MNDRPDDLSIDTTDIADVGLDTEDSEQAVSDSVTESVTDSSDNSVSDALGDTSDSSSDSETIQTDSSTSSETDTGTDSETSQDIPVSGSENTETFFPSEITDSSTDYTSEFEYIDYLLNTQIDEMNAVQTVSGNSINVSFDDTTNQTLQEMKQGQALSIENQNTMINLMSCILLALVLDFLIASARRTAKKMHGRKE